MKVCLIRKTENVTRCSSAHACEYLTRTYLVWCHNVDMFSAKISMYNVVYMKVVQSARHLGQEHNYVALLASSVKDVFFQVTKGRVY